MKKFHFLPAEFMFVLCMDFRTYSEYFSMSGPEIFFLERAPKLSTFGAMLLRDHGNFQLQYGVLGSFILYVTVINYLSHPSCFCLPKCPGRLQGPPSFLFSRYRGLFPRAKAAEG
jgi:hypothetical protein